MRHWTAKEDANLIYLAHFMGIPLSSLVDDIGRSEQAMKGRLSRCRKNGAVTAWLKMHKADLEFVMTAGHIKPDTSDGIAVIEWESSISRCDNLLAEADT